MKIGSGFFLEESNIIFQKTSTWFLVYLRFRFLNSSCHLGRQRQRRYLKLGILYKNEAQVQFYLTTIFFLSFSVVLLLVVLFFRQLHIVILLSCLRIALLTLLRCSSCIVALSFFWHCCLSFFMLIRLLFLCYYFAFLVLLPLFFSHCHSLCCSLIFRYLLAQLLMPFFSHYRYSFHTAIAFISLVGMGLPLLSLPCAS